MSSIVLASLLLLWLSPSVDALGGEADSTARQALADTAQVSHRLEPRGTLAEGSEGRARVLEPAGVASDAFGRVWISDAQLHRVQRFDRDGHWLGESGTLGSGPGELRRPGAVVALGAAHMAVLDQENRRVVVYDLFGRLQGTRLDLADAELESELGRVEPVGLAGDRGGGLYVADPAGDRVLAFDASGRFVRALGGYGTRPGQMRGPAGLAVAPRGELIVTERGNARLQRLDAGGRAAGGWGLAIERGDAGVLPVAVDAEGRVAVADEAGGTLWVFDRDGRLLARLSQLSAPRAVGFAPDGTLLVAEARPGRVRRFALVASPGN